MSQFKRSVTKQKKAKSETHICRAGKTEKKAPLLVSNVADEEIGHESHHHRKRSEGEELAFALLVDLARDCEAVVVVIRILDGRRQMDQRLTAEQSEEQAHGIPTREKK